MHAVRSNPVGHTLLIITASLSGVTVLHPQSGEYGDNVYNCICVTRGGAVGVLVALFLGEMVGISSSSTADTSSPSYRQIEFWRQGLGKKDICQTTQPPAARADPS